MNGIEFEQLSFISNYNITRYKLSNDSYSDKRFAIDDITD